MDGNVFIDFTGGIGVVNAGHRAPLVVEAVKRQADHFLHTCFQVVAYESFIKLAEQLNELTPGTFAKKTFFVNSGAEAVENAVKIACCHTKRSSVICFQDAFHGRTSLTMALTGKPKPYKAGFGPFPGNVYRIPFANCYRCSYGRKCGNCDLVCAEALEDTFVRQVAAESVAAVLVEPVQGEGGFIVPPRGFLPRLQEICRRHGIVFIVDEVQTGFARTGAMFASERLGIEPDIITSAKALGGGLPIAAITGRVEIMDSPFPGAIGGTFGGNPLSCEAALATIAVIHRDNLSARANLLGERFRVCAAMWQSRWPQVGDVRGLGAMQAFELVKTREKREPDGEMTKKVISYCYEHGLLTLSAGPYGNVLRLLMPLSITDGQFDEALGIIESALESVLG